MAVSDVTTTVAPLATVNTNVLLPHTLAGPLTIATKENTNVFLPHTLAGPLTIATKENQFPPSLSGF